MQVIGSSNSNSVKSPARLASVTITAGAGGAGSISVYAGGDTSAAPIVTLNIPMSESGQFFFSDVPFPDGFTVVPNADVASYLVEYGTI